MSTIFIIKAGPLAIIDGIGDASHIGDVAVNYQPFLWDHLDWGPLHPDPALQSAMRLCFFRAELDDYPKLEAYRTVMHDEQVTLWGEQRLHSVLSLSWLVSALARDTALAHGSLALETWPFLGSVEGRPDGARLAATYAARVPLAEVASAIASAFLALASGERVVPARVGHGVFDEWLRLLDRLWDFLPDSRGLDILDRAILASVALATWSPTPTLIASVGRELWTHGHHVHERRILDRLFELSDHGRIGALASGDYRPLLEARVTHPITYGTSEFRLTDEGASYRSNRRVKPWREQLPRWVGGRCLYASGLR